MSTTENFLLVQKATIAMLGFDLFSGSGEMWKYRHRCINVYSIATIFPFILAAVIHNLKNVMLLADAMVALLITILGLFKFSMIIYLRKDFWRMIDTFRHLMTHEGEQGDEYAQIIITANKQDQRVCGIFRTCFFLAWALNSVLPFVRMGLSYWLSGHVEPELPFPCLFPWDIHNKRNYALTFLWCAFASTGVVLPAVSLDTIFCSFTSNLCAFFKIAQYKVLRFKSETPEESQAKLNKIFALYQKSLDMCTELNHCYEPIICAQFFISSLQLCMLGYLFSITFSQTEGVYYASFIATIIIQAYIYCYCGENVKTESALFEWAIYDSPWHESLGSGLESSSICRSLLISMMRASHGFRITGYFFEANMEAFSSIVRTAMSYITMLRSFS
ncbi:GL17719 [Drosophila persimilis]|uniref:Odorant receptor n=1 Tax=Drosophila persimilis TaxID=7234 RepID=B4GIH8_DROPE|nr:odorant receptor 47a [Drosophila persimilis]EDW36298.1 GL17719 [Drosophila persimilis]